MGSHDPDGFCLFPLLALFHAFARPRCITCTVDSDLAAIGYNGYYDTNHLIPVAVTIHNRGWP